MLNSITKFSDILIWNWGTNPDSVQIVLGILFTLIAVSISLFFVGIFVKAIVWFVRIFK